METTKTIGKISRRVILLSSIILLSLSTTANTIYEGPGMIKNNMFVFYLTGILFFTVYLLYVKISRSPKNIITLNTVRRKHYHYRKVVKKTA